jgi:hypothetical protein
MHLQSMRIGEEIMRRVLFSGIAILLVFVLGACEEKNTIKSKSKPNNSITVAELTDRETAILSATSEQSFVFDFKLDPTFKNVSVWVEKYESGELVGEIGKITTEIKEEGYIIFSKSRVLEETNQSIFSIGINSDKSNVSGSTQDTSPDKESAGIFGTNPLLENAQFNIKMLLAVLCYKKGGYGLSTPSSEFYSDPEGHNDELKNYDIVYLLRSEFSNEKID